MEKQGSFSGKSISLSFIWVPRWYSGNVDITDWMYRLLGSWVQSQLMSKPYCCALNWSLATSNLKPIWNSGRFLREGHIHMKDSSASIFLSIIIFYSWLFNWSFKFSRIVEKSVGCSCLNHKSISTKKTMEIRETKNQIKNVNYASICWIIQIFIRKLFFSSKPFKTKLKSTQVQQSISNFLSIDASRGGKCWDFLLLKPTSFIVTFWVF
jgi:hypothetical protein